MPRGWWEAVHRGVAFHRCAGRLVSGAVLPPAAHPLGRAATVRRLVFPGRGWCGRGDPARAAQRALLRAVVARCRSGVRASLGGAPCLIVMGGLGLGARPPLAARQLGGQLGPVAHLLWARVRWCGCAARPWGGRPGLGASGVCGACVVVVCCWVRGGAVCAVVPWCVVLPLSVRRPGAPSLALPRGVVLAVASGFAPFPAGVPSLGCWLPSIFLLRCGILYPFLYCPLVCLPPWRVFFPASLVSLGVSRYFSLPASSFSGSSSSSSS